MKKNLSRTVMIIFAVLLTLVLISTSTVSGIFAKYVIEKDATTIVSLKKFGVKLELKEGNNYAASGAQVKSGAFNTTNASSITVTVTVSLAPGDDFEEIIKFVPSIDSTVRKASVDTNIKVKAEVVALTNNQYSSSYYVPAGFYVNSTLKSNAFISHTNNETLKSTLATNLNTGIRDALGLASTATPTNGFYQTQLVAKDSDDLSVESIGFGAICPSTSTVTNADAMITKLAEQGAQVEIKYTVSLEQA